MTSPGAKSALAELEGLQLLAKGDTGPAFDSFAKAGSMRPEAPARAHLKARNFGFAEVKAREAVARAPNQVVPLAAQVEILHACGKDKEAREAYRLLEPLARSADKDLPVFQRLAGIVERWKAEKSWTPSVAAAGDDAKVRERLLAERERVRKEIEAKRAELESLDGGNAVQRSKLADALLANDIEIIKIESDLAASKAAAKKKAERDESQERTDQREKQIGYDFLHDPEVVALTDEIVAAVELRDDAEEFAQSPDDPARRAAGGHYKKLMGKYEKLWESKYEELSTRLELKKAKDDEQTKRTLDDLEVSLSSLKEQKAKLIQLFDKANGEKKSEKDGTTKAELLRRQLETLVKRAGEPDKSFDRLKIDLTTVGPLTWAPFPAEAFTRTDTAGAKWSLADQKGKSVLLLFFLGGKCATACSSFRFSARSLMRSRS